MFKLDNKNMVNKKTLNFTFVSDGTATEFEAFKTIVCPFEQRKRTQLDFYRDLVAFRNSPSVFILDNTGNVLPIS